MINARCPKCGEMLETFLTCCPCVLRGMTFEIFEIKPGQPLVECADCLTMEEHFTRHFPTPDWRERYGFTSVGFAGFGLPQNTGDER